MFCTDAVSETSSLTDEPSTEIYAQLVLLDVKPPLQFPPGRPVPLCSLALPLMYARNKACKMWALTPGMKPLRLWRLYDLSFVICCNQKPV